VEGKQVGFLHGSFGDDGIDEGASRLLVVHHKVLDVANDMLSLFALHEIADHGAGEKGISSRVFEGAAISRFPSKANTTPQGHVEALRPKIAANHIAERTSRFHIPARCRSQA
jgi:hypothetical protein